MAAAKSINCTTIIYTKVIYIWIRYIGGGGGIGGRDGGRDGIAGNDGIAGSGGGSLLVGSAGSDGKAGGGGTPDYLLNSVMCWTVS